MSMRLLYGHFGLSPADASILAQAMEELPRLLAIPPVGLSIGTELVADSEDLERAFKDARESFGNPLLYDFMQNIRSQLGRDALLVVGCGKDHSLAREIRKINPDALWGGTWSEVGLAVCWRIEKPVVWHEALHLLGAHDCYCLPDKGPTCEQPNCIMQYMPSADAGGEQLALCSENIADLRSHVRTCTE